MSRISDTGTSVCLALVALLLLYATMFAQGIAPYPNAITNKLIYQETPMVPPPVNVVFNDPDFRFSDGSSNR